MEEKLQQRTARVNKLIEDLKLKLETLEEVVTFIVYGSYSESTDHQPTLYSDVDLEIIVKDENYEKYLENFKAWFESNFEPVLIETRLGHLEKIFVTSDFVDLQFHITRLSDMDRINSRQLNYFPNGYSILFDKTNIIEQKIQNSLQPKRDKTDQQKFDELNSSFWYFVQGTAPYITRGEYWFGASGYWVWLYFLLTRAIRIYYHKEVAENNPLKHIEKDLPEEVLKEIQPLRNLETVNDLKNKMKLLIDVYSRYAQKINQENDLSYDPKIEDSVRVQVAHYLT